MKSDQNQLLGGDQMLNVSKALLAKVQAALDKAANKEELLTISGTSMIVCPREKQPNKGFEPIGYIQKDGRSYAFGLYRTE